MKKTIFVKLVIPGIHFWKDCDINAVSYLKDQHRHLFHIKVTCSVNHSDRETEFLFLQKEIRQYLYRKYWNEYNGAMILGGMSCEMLCEDLLENFPKLISCEVSEDGENGAIVCRE